MGSRARTSGLVASLLSACLWVPAVFAEAPPKDAARAKAKAALARATDAYRARRYAEAAAAYLEAHDVLVAGGLGSRPKLLYNAGLAHDRLGDCDVAADLYQRFLTTAPREATPEFKQRLAAAERCAPKVALTSEPGGADVLVDGRPRGQTPLVLHLKSGSYTLTVSKPGFKQQRRAITQVAGQPLALTFLLKPAGRWGRLALDVGFAAEILLDGELVASGPYRGIRSVKPGQHRVRLLQSGCAPREFTVDVPEGQVPLSLTPESACTAAAAPPPPPIPAVIPPTTTVSRPVPTSVWLTGGVGIAAAIAGGVFSGLHVSAANRRDRLDADPTVTEGQVIRDADDEAFRWSVASGVGYGIAVAGIGAALALWLGADDAGAAPPVEAGAQGLVVRW